MNGQSLFGELCETEPHHNSAAKQGGDDGLAAYVGIWRDADTKISRKNLLRLIDLQEFQCALTGVELTPDDATVDHRVALKNGGAHNMSNLQAVHEAVNVMKGTMDEDEFVYWCCRVADHSRRN